MDEEQTGDYRKPCGVCDAVDWGISDEGRFYCRSCHNVIERTREVVDTGTLMIGANRVSTLSKGSKHKKQERGRQWMVCEGFQVILIHQAEALLKLGVCAQFKDDVLCQFWRRYLQKSRQAYTKNPIPILKRKAPSQDSESDSAPEFSASETDGEGECASVAESVTGNWSSGSVDAASYYTPSRRGWVPHCVRKDLDVMSMPRTLALCHLALLWVREAVTLADLLRLVNEGHVPYVNAHEYLPDEMKVQGRDVGIFRVNSVPPHRALLRVAHKLAVYLDLPLFPSITKDCLLHPSLISLRYLTDANLPDELHDWVCRVSEQADMVDDSFNTYGPERESLPHYDLQGAALIIITMKLLFKLDDGTEWDLSNEASDRNKDNPEGNCFNLRQWYKMMASVLTKARQREKENIARKQWKSQKQPLCSVSRSGHRAMVFKRSRVAEQLQTTFRKLSGSSAPPPPSSPSSFCFRWGEGEGVDGPSLHHQRLDPLVTWQGGNVQFSNTAYWHHALKACTGCVTHYPDVAASLPKMYHWLLQLFSFLVGVRPGCVYEEVLKVERRFLMSGPPKGQQNLKPWHGKHPK